MLTSLRILLLLVMVTSAANAQISASLRLNKSQYVAGEPVVAIVTITNHAGRELAFHGDGRRGWLDFNIRNRSGQAVSGRGRQDFGAMRIAAGQTLQREVDLSSHFMLHEQGNFSVAATIRSQADATISAATNRVIFTLNPGRVFWSQQVGVPNRRNQVREYRVLQFNGNQRSQLYAQVVDHQTGLPMRTFVMGDALSVRKPSVTVDKNQRMHVLFLATPTMWVHYIIDLEGNVANRDIHQRGSHGDPRLVTFADGSVQVANSIPYDPNAAAAARAKIRRISERPPFVYQ
jgi:hypothetical protein